MIENDEHHCEDHTFHFDDWVNQSVLTLDYEVIIHLNNKINRVEVKV